MFWWYIGSLEWNGSTATELCWHGHLLVLLPSRGRLPQAWCIAVTPRHCFVNRGVYTHRGVITNHVHYLVVAFMSFFPCISSNCLTSVFSPFFYFPPFCYLLFFSFLFPISFLILRKCLINFLRLSFIISFYVFLSFPVLSFVPYMWTIPFSPRFPSFISLHVTHDKFPVIYIRSLSVSSMFS